MNYGTQSADGSPAPREETGMCVSGAGVQRGRMLTFGHNVDGWEFTKYHHGALVFSVK